MQHVTISQALTFACRDIERVDAQMLLQHALNVTYVHLLTYSDQMLNTQQLEEFQHLVQRRIDGVPVAYLTGERAFYDVVLNVNEAVLIPRPETELLVELALQLIPLNRPCRVLDLGTGSGAIAIAIAKHRPQSQVTAVDFSPSAMAVCRQNAQNLQIRNLSFVIGNWFDELSEEKFNLIVSNPPYVAGNDPHLQQGDLRFEPQAALSAGDDGFSCIHHIIDNAPDYLHKDGWLLFEHGYSQASVCRQLLQNRGFSNICSYPDLAGIMRVSGGQLNFVK